MPKEKPGSHDQEVGLNIKFFRIRHRITQASLAKYLGVSVFQLQKYEKGANRVSSEKLQLLCAIFQCTLEDITGSVPFKINMKKMEGDEGGDLNDGAITYGRGDTPPSFEDLYKLYIRLPFDKKVALTKFLKAFL